MTSPVVKTEEYDRIQVYRTAFWWLSQRSRLLRSHSLQYAPVESVFQRFGFIGELLLYCTLFVLFLHFCRNLSLFFDHKLFRRGCYITDVVIDNLKFF